MSQFVAVVAFEGDSLSSSAPTDLAVALSEWPGKVVVEAPPGAALGISMASADQSRRNDRQPAVDTNAQLAVVADCRLDNRMALRSALGLEPHVTDAAILLRGYERWGTDLPSHLAGDFAGMLWDWRNKRAIAFRDPLGVKPLFYRYFGDRLIVASEVDLILKTAPPRVVLDDRLVVEHLLWQYSSVNRTFWADISRLPGGHSLVAARHDRAVRRYWFPARPQGNVSNQSEVAEFIATLFKQSVERRLDADGPVFAHLSGGLDSSSIVCVANQIRRRVGVDMPDLRALSERFPGMLCDEGPFIQAVLDWTGIEGISWVDHSTSFPDLDQPALSGPGIKTYRTTGNTEDIEIIAKAGGRVLLSGQGGDQLGSAAEVVDDMIDRAPWTFAFETLRQAGLTLAQRRLRTRLMLRSLVPLTVRRALGTRRYRRGLPRWLLPRHRDLASSLGRDLYRESDVEFPDRIRCARWKDLTSASLGTTLDLDHRGAALRGVEVRYPFLDQDLVSGVLAVPTDLWPRPSANARIHRRAMSGLLPPSLQNRRTKALFTQPMARRLKSESEALRRLFYQGEWLSEAYVDRDQAKGLVDQMLSAPTVEQDWEVVRGVWGIATLEAWLRTILRYSSPGEELSYERVT